MTTDPPTPLRLVRSSAPPDEFAVYHWTNPKVTYEYSYLATNADRSVLLSLGENSLSFDFEIPPDAERWLTKDYAPTGEHFHLDMTAVHNLIKKAFPGGALFGFVQFAENLTIRGMDLSIYEQQFCDDGPEYLIHAPGHYERWYRKYDRYESLSPAERAMLEGCCAIFAPLAGSSAHLLKAPTTPKYQPKASPVTQ